MKTISETILEIEQLFQNQGHHDYYGEDISQFEHAAQTAILARNRGEDFEMQIAAFLHDIGHMLPAEPKSLTQNYGTLNHEKIAADCLKARGFSGKIISLIENHVNAKRYLCFKYGNYHEKLSDPSKETLKMQGGIMSQLEAEQFMKHIYFEEIIQLRRFDEATKIPNKDVPSIDYFLDLCSVYLTSKLKNNQFQAT